MEAKLGAKQKNDLVIGSKNKDQNSGAKFRSKFRSKIQEQNWEQESEQIPKLYLIRGILFQHWQVYIVYFEFGHLLNI